MAVSALFAANGFAVGVWAAHISVFKQNYHLSNSQLTIPLFTLALGSVFATPFAGWLFHRFDSSAIACKGQLGYAALLTILPWTPSLAWLATGTFCFGLCRGMVDVSTNTLAIHTERAYGSAVMSSVQGFWSLGGVLGAALSSMLLRLHASSRCNLAIAGAAILVTALVSQRYVLADEPAADRPAGWAVIPRALWAIAAVTFLALFIEDAIGDWSTVYLRSALQASASRAATGYAVFSFSMMTGCFFGDHVNRKLGPVRLMQVSGALLAAGFGLTLAAGNYIVAMIGLLIAGFGLSNMVALVFGAAARRNPSAVGAAIAAAASVGYLGALAGPPAIGFLSVIAGLRSALWLIVLAGAIITLSARSVLAKQDEANSKTGR
jgi:MFS family permease